MHIQTRDIKGGVQILPQEYRFVEICDDDGKIGCAIYKSSNNTLHIIYPDDVKEVKRYEDTFNVKFCKRTVEVPIDINDHRNTHQR